MCLIKDSSKNTKCKGGGVGRVQIDINSTQRRNEVELFRRKRGEGEG